MSEFLKPLYNSQTPYLLGNFKYKHEIIVFLKTTPNLLTNEGKTIMWSNVNNKCVNEIKNRNHFEGIKIPLLIAYGINLELYH